MSTEPGFPIAFTFNFFVNLHWITFIHPSITANGEVVLDALLTFIFLSGFIINQVLFICFEESSDLQNFTNHPILNI